MQAHLIRYPLQYPLHFFLATAKMTQARFGGLPGLPLRPHLRDESGQKDRSPDTKIELARGKRLS